MLEIIDRTIAECMTELRALQGRGPNQTTRIEVDRSTVLEIDSEYQATLIRNNRVYRPVQSRQHVFPWEFIADDAIFQADFRTHTNALPAKPFFDSVRAYDTEEDGRVKLVFTVNDYELKSGGSYSTVQKPKRREVIFYIK